MSSNLHVLSFSLGSAPCICYPCLPGSLLTGQPPYQAAFLPDSLLTGQPPYQAASLPGSLLTRQPPYRAASLPGSVLTGQPPYRAASLPGSLLTGQPPYQAASLPGSLLTPVSDRHQILLCTVSHLFPEYKLQGLLSLWRSEASFLIPFRKSVSKMCQWIFHEI